MSLPLFRPEVMQAQQVQWLGSIRIARPPGFALVTALAITCATALVAFALWGEYTRKVTLPGVLVPEGGVMDISSPQSGTVTEVLVKEGDEVQAGQALIRLRAERQLAAGEMGQLQAAAVAQRRQGLEAELRSLEQQAQQRAATLNDRLRSLQSDKVSLQSELESMQRRVALAAKTAKDFESLAANGFMSHLQAQQMQEELLELGQRERSALRQSEAGEREVAGVQAELSLVRTQLESSRAQLQRESAALNQERIELDARSHWLLSAPRAGRIATLNTLVGQAVTAGATVASLLPGDAGAGGNLVAYLYAPSRSVAFLRSGQDVLLQIAAYPFGRYGFCRGVVRSIGQIPVNSNILSIAAARKIDDEDESIFRVVVYLTPLNAAAGDWRMKLRPGLILHAQLQLERIKIWRLVIGDY